MILIKKKAAAASSLDDVITFGTSEWMDLTADISDSTDCAAAFRVKRKIVEAGSGVNYIVASGAGAGDTNYRISDSNDRTNVKLESTSGTLILSGTGTTDEWEFDAAHSVVITWKSGLLNVFFDSNTAQFTDTDTGFTMKSFKYANTSLTDGTGAVDMQWIGGFWISTASGAGDLDYNNFFDGAGAPTFGTGSVGGIAPDLALKTVAAFNAYGGMTGTAT